MGQLISGIEIYFFRNNESHSILSLQNVNFYWTFCGETWKFDATLSTILNVHTKVGART